jgi:hypothetical protein
MQTSNIMQDPLSDAEKQIGVSIVLLHFVLCGTACH